MDSVIVFALLGLTAGAIYAALALGIVITYKGTGVINFAAGAMAAWGTYVFDEVHRSGWLMLPVPVNFLPYRIHVGEASIAVAIALGLLSAALLGLLVHLLVFRPLRSAPTLAKVVASVGVMVTLDALIVLRFGSVARIVNPILPDDPIALGTLSVSADRLLLGGAAVLVGLAAWAFFRFAKLGLAVRAGAESERAVALAGYSPDVLAGTAWVGATVAATLLCILAAPLIGLAPQVLTLMIVPALACALVGRLSFVGATVAAALLLGVLQSELTYLTAQDWWPSWAVNGLGDAAPFVVLIVVLFVVGRRLPARGAVQVQRLPSVVLPKNRPGVVAALAIAGVLAIVLTSGSYRYGVITSMIIAIAALSLVVVTGLVGQISLAQAAIAGCAGFTLSKLADGAGIPFPWSPLLSVAAATLLGVLVGIPALRIRGAQLAVVTLAAAVALQRFVFENPSFTRLSGNPIPDAHVLGLDLSISAGRDVARVAFGLFVLLVLVVVTVAVGNLMRSATGRRFLAVRENEQAGASVGIDVAAQKLTAFAIASALAGIAGCLLGYSRQQLSSQSFDVLVSLSWLAFAYLGGITSVAGALVAGTLAPLGIGFVLLDRLLDVGSSYTLISGILLVLTAIFNPIGVVGAMRATGEAVAGRLRSARPRAHDDDTLTPTAEAAAAARPAGRTARRAAVARSDAPPLLLDARDVTVSYGGVHAVNAASLRVHRGEIVGLIGPNGAGKTSFVDGLTGFTRASGEIVLDGASLHGLPAHARAQRGLRRTWQAVEPFDDLTVRQNLQVAAEPATLRSMLLDVVRPSRAADTPGVAWALGLLGLEGLADRKPGDLSLGHQKLLGVARTLAARPKVVLLDEPAAGLDSAESIAFGATLEDIAATGIGVLLIDHDMDLVLGVCDYVYVLEFGVVIAEGSAQEIRANPKVVEAYLGGQATAGAAPAVATTSGGEA